MAAFYHTFVSARTTEPDFSTLLNSARANDPNIGVQHETFAPVYVVKKPTDWTTQQIAFVQSAIDTAPAITPERTAQSEIDAWEIAEQAFALAVMDELNVLRAAVGKGLQPLVAADFLAKIRTKAGTL